MSIATQIRDLLVAPEPRDRVTRRCHGDYQRRCIATLIALHIATEWMEFRQMEICDEPPEPVAPGTRFWRHRHMKRLRRVLQDPTGETATKWVNAFRLLVPTDRHKQVSQALWIRGHRLPTDGQRGRWADDWLDKQEQLHPELKLVDVPLTIIKSAPPAEVSSFASGKPFLDGKRDIIRKERADSVAR